MRTSGMHKSFVAPAEDSSQDQRYVHKIAFSGLLNPFIFLWIALIILFVLPGCRTTQTGLNQVIIAQSTGDEDYSKLDAIEELLLAYTANEDVNALAKAERDIRGLLEKAVYNKEYEARLFGLYGEILFYTKKTWEAGEALKKGEAAFKKEPQLFILRALLEPKSAEKVRILEEGLKTTPNSGKICLYLAGVYFQAGEYSKAAGLYDDAFFLLGDVCKKYYQVKRYLAFRFMQSPPDNAAMMDYLGMKTLFVEDAVKILLAGSYLDALAPKKDTKPAALLQKLKDEHYVFPPALLLTDTLLRKDLACILLAIISRLEKKPAILDMYSKQYTTNNMASPVPDVKVDDYYFDAVLNLVERELMELPDGIHFLPDNPVSGQELYASLNAIKQNYGN